MTATAETKKVKGPASYFPSIENKYGRPIVEWKAILRASAGYREGARHLQLVRWLKEQHDMGHGHADALVAHTLHEDS